MAKQKGFLPLRGTLGNMTFVRTKDGMLVREKSSLEADRIKKDPAFERTRENMSEFAKAAAGARLLRTAIRALLKNSFDKKANQRLIRSMMKVIKSDTTSARGFRTLEQGDLEQLKGFQFNEKTPLSSVLPVKITATIDRVSGELTLNLPSFIPANAIDPPEGSTHFRIISAGVEINFGKDAFDAITAYSVAIPLNRVATAPIALKSTLTPASVHPLMLIAGIEFLQFSNDDLYPIKNQAFFALALVQVSVV